MATTQVPELDINRFKRSEYDPKRNRHKPTIYDDIRSMNNSLFSDNNRKRPLSMMKTIYQPLLMPPPPPPVPSPEMLPLFPKPQKIFPSDLYLREAERILYGDMRAPPPPPPPPLLHPIIVQRPIPIVNIRSPPKQYIVSSPMRSPPKKHVISSPVVMYPPRPYNPNNYPPQPYPQPPHPPPPQPPHNQQDPNPHTDPSTPIKPPIVQPGHNGDKPVPPESARQEIGTQTDKKNPTPSKEQFEKAIKEKFAKLNNLLLDDDPNNENIDLTPLTQAKDNYIQKSQQLLTALNQLAQDRKQQTLVAKVLGYLKSKKPKQQVSWPNY